MVFGGRGRIRRIAGALTREEFERELRAAGFQDVTIRETHRVHEHASSAIVRAKLPTSHDPDATSSP